MIFTKIENEFSIYNKMFPKYFKGKEKRNNIKEENKKDYKINNFEENIKKDGKSKNKQLDYIIKKGNEPIGQMNKMMFMKY
jgi:hypothetical protein